MHDDVLPKIKKESMCKLKTYLENKISSIGVSIGKMEINASFEWIRLSCLVVTTSVRTLT